MISNPAMSYPATVPRQFTLNDLRVRSYAAEEKSSNSALGVSGMVLVAVLAIHRCFHNIKAPITIATNTPAGCCSREVKLYCVCIWTRTKTVINSTAKKSR